MRGKRKKQFKDKNTITSQLTALRLVSLLCISLFIVGAAWSAFFTHKTIQDATAQAEQIILLKSELAIEPIDFIMFNNAEEAWQKKHTTSTPNIKKNPFFTQTELAAILAETTPEAENTEEETPETTLPAPPQEPPSLDL